MSSQLQPRISRDRRVFVFNPTHLAKDVQVFGDFYHFEPFGVGTCSCAHHNVPGRVDNVGVHAKYDWPRDDRNRLLMDRPREVLRPALGEQGEGVADHIVSRENVGNLHFIILEGTVAEQEGQKADAIHAYIEVHMPEVESTIDTWEAQLSSYMREHPSAQVPRQPKHVQEAYRYREKHLQASYRVADQAYIVCRTCGDRLPDEPAYAEHRQRRHAGMAEEPEPKVSPRPAAKWPAPLAIADPPEQPEEPPGEWQGPLQPGEEPSKKEEEKPEEKPDEKPDPTEEDFAEGRGVGGVSVGHGDGEELSAQARMAPSPPKDADRPSRPASMARTERPKTASQKLIDRAERAGVVLSVADRKGLTSGDRDVLQDVWGRLRQAGVQT
jgi:hypothetical protein